MEWISLRWLGDSRNLENAFDGAPFVIIVMLSKSASYVTYGAVLRMEIQWKGAWTGITIVTRML
jgi:hypothetical protein